MFFQNFKLKSVKFESNKIEFMPLNLFEGLAELIEVNFSNNHIKTLGAIFRSNAKLKTVDFRSNEIKYIAPELFHADAELYQCEDPCGFLNNTCTFGIFHPYDFEDCEDNWKRVFFWLKSGKMNCLYIDRYLLFKSYINENLGKKS